MEDASWTKTTSSFTATQETSTVHGGSSSLNFTFTSTSNQDLESDIVAISPNTNYTFSFYAYDNDPAGQVRIVYGWYDSTDTIIGWNYGGYSDPDSTSWKELTMSGTSPANAAGVAFRLRGYDVSAGWDGDATIYCDDYCWPYNRVFCVDCEICDIKWDFQHSTFPANVCEKDPE